MVKCQPAPLFSSVWLLTGRVVPPWTIGTCMYTCTVCGTTSINHLHQYHSFADQPLKQNHKEIYKTGFYFFRFSMNTVFDLTQAYKVACLVWCELFSVAEIRKVGIAGMEPCKPTYFYF